jgi:16S rRNA G966 N2-methylase RsmD
LPLRADIRDVAGLHYGDNLQVLRDSIASESVDLTYLDPPFNANAIFNVGLRMRG